MSSLSSGLSLTFFYSFTTSFNYSSDLKRYLIIIICVLGFLHVAPTMLQAQALGEWAVYPSYHLSTQHVRAGKVIYSLMNGNLLRYDTEDESVKLYDCLGELSDVHINFIAYCEEAKRMILVYDNENIDLLDSEDNVVNISSLKDKALSGKDVAGVSISGTTAYLATGFGFLCVDMKEGVVRDTYQLGIDVKSVAVCGDLLWICGMNGVYSTPLDNSDIHNLSSWKRRHAATNWLQIAVQGEDVVIRHKSAVYRFLPTTSPMLKSGTFTYLRALADGTFCFGNANEVDVYSTSSGVQTYTFGNDWRDVSAGSNGTYWVSDGENGLRPYRLADGEWVVGNEKIQPNSPCRDMFYRMHYVTNAKGDYRLLVAGGTNTTNDVFTDVVAMYYEDGEWTNFDETPASELLPGVKQRNTTDLVQDPLDDTHHFAGTWRNGLKEYKNAKLQRIYTSDNSPLLSILPDDAAYHQYEPATAAQYDADGNLWVANQGTGALIQFITPEGKWHSLSYDELAEVKYVSGYLFSSSGVNFLISQSWPAAGIFAFETNGTLTNVRDDQHRFVTTIVNQDETSYDPSTCNCMVEDFDGRIWCGTGRGLFVIDNARQFFDKDFRFTQVKIARNDGSGLADYLLNGVSILCVAVDGGNRKWIGTEGNGVYLVSADGTELLHHFMESDSPLLSNNVQSIAVHPRTGEVFFGTDKGLCSFMADATEAKDDLVKDDVIAYPNPVRPDFNGPIRIEGLTFNAEVKICSTTGQLIWSGTSNGGTCTWNGCNKQGRRVASGVYNVIANTEDGKKAVVCRIVVIK